MTRRSVHSLLDRLATQETAAIDQELLAPATGGGHIAVRIGSISCRLRIAPRNYRGWGVFRSSDFKTAKYVRDATLAQRCQYLELLPRVLLIACLFDGKRWYGCMANLGDQRLHLHGLAPIMLPSAIERFQTVACRFDGNAFWYEDACHRGDPTMAGFLRQQLTSLTEPKAIVRLGLTAEQRAAYELAFVHETVGKMEVEAMANRRKRHLAPLNFSVDTVRAQLCDALSHAGADLVDYLEREDGYRVSFKIGRQTFTSSVNKNDLSLQVAGICLSGEDAKFDLGSLVGVLREGRGAGEVVLVGENGMDEETYWDVHPPT